MISRIQVFKPYEYTCLFDSRLLSSLKDKLTPQQATNIVKKSIEEYGNGRDIFWYQRVGMSKDENYIENRFEKATFDRQKIIPYCIDDYIELPIEHAEKPYKLLGLIANKLSIVGATAKYKIKAEDLISCYIPVEPHINETWYSSEGDKIIDYLVDKAYVDKYWDRVRDHRPTARAGSLSQSGVGSNKKWQVALTMDGWAALSSLESQPSNKVFIAMAFSAWDEAGKIKGRESLISAIKNACSKFGYEADIVSGDHTGNITDKIIAEIKRSKFMICDFTYQNQGAYYEAGYARALGKPVYHLVRDDYFNSLHFDIRQINCRKWTTPEGIENILLEWLGANEENIDKTRLDLPFS